MKTGDWVLFVESETPEARAVRKGETLRKTHPRPRRVGWIDKVKSVTNKKAKFEKDANAETDDTGKETAASRNKRATAGEPTREALVVDVSWFPSPFPVRPGMRIDLDDGLVQAIRRRNTQGVTNGTMGAGAGVDWPLGMPESIPD